MKKIFSILLLLLTTADFAPAQIHDSSLTEIELAYVSGQYLSAELDARRLLEQTDLSDSVKVQLQKWIAFSLIAQGKSGAAKDRFIALLQMDESFELDPILTSPKILYVFNDARGTYLSKRKLVMQDSSRTEMNRRDGKTGAVSFRTIVFPGWEQIHQGRNETGYWFLGAGIVSVTSGVVCEVLRSNAREKYLKATTVSEISSNYDTYNFYRKAEYISFSLFALTYILSEADVFYHSPITVEPVFSRNNAQYLRISYNF